MTAFAEGEKIDIVVIPFSSSGVASELARELTTATATVYEQLGANVELSGVDENEVLTLSGCHATDDKCLAAIPATLGASAVVFGSARMVESNARVVLIIVEEGVPKRRENVVLRGSSVRETVALYRESLRRRLAKNAPPASAPDDSQSVLSEAASAGEMPATLEAGEHEPAALESGPSVWDARRVGRGPWITLGAGGGALALGGVFALLGRNTQSRIDDAPTTTVDDLKRLEQLEDQASRRYLIGNVFLVAGLSAAVVGAVWVVRDGRADRAGPHVAISPLLLGDGGGVSIAIGSGL